MMHHRHKSSSGGDNNRAFSLRKTHGFLSHVATFAVGAALVYLLNTPRATVETSSIVDKSKTETPQIRKLPWGADPPDKKMNNNTMATGQPSQVEVATASPSDNNVKVQPNDEPQSQSLHSSQEQDIGFRFPSVEERVKIYMGSWINITSVDISLLQKDFCSKDILNSGSNPGPVILGLGEVAKCFEGKRGLLNTYCIEALPMLVDATAHSLRPTKHELMVITRPGDSVTKSNIPLVVKARRLWNRDGTPSASNILWPFMVKRHYSNLFESKNKLHKISWKDKKDTLIWRGGPTGKRPDVVEKLFSYPNLEDIDVAFNKVGSKSDLAKQERMEAIHRKSVQIPELVEYKYLLSLEGNDVASGLKWMLYSNSVVFMARPTHATWAMEDRLEPFVHYIPIKDDFTNVPEMLEWARQHQKECQEISARATKFIDDLIMSDQARKDNQDVLNSLRAIYQERFGSVLFEYCNDIETSA